MSQPKKNSTNLLILAVALLIAVALMIFMLVQRNDLSQKNEALTAELATSQQNWQTVSAQKEVLQTELADVNSSLREAQTSLQESLDKAVELNAQISTLTTEKEGLQVDLADALAVQTQLNEYIATTTDLLTATQLNLATTSDLLATTTTERDTLSAQVVTLSKQLEDAQTVVTAVNADLKAARKLQLESLNLLKGHLTLSEAEYNKQLAKSGLTASARETITQAITNVQKQIVDLDERIAAVTELVGE